MLITDHRLPFVYSTPSGLLHSGDLLPWVAPPASAYPWLMIFKASGLTSVPQFLRPSVPFPFYPQPSAFSLQPFISIYLRKSAEKSVQICKKYFYLVLANCQLPLAICCLRNSAGNSAYLCEKSFCLVTPTILHSSGCRDLAPPSSPSARFVTPLAGFLNFCFYSSLLSCAFCLLSYFKCPQPFDSKSLRLSVP
jgi:hypothetical protein